MKTLGFEVIHLTYPCPLGIHRDRNLAFKVGIWKLPSSFSKFGCLFKSPRVGRLARKPEETEAQSPEIAHNRGSFRRSGQRTILSLVLDLFFFSPNMNFEPYNPKQILKFLIFCEAPNRRKVLSTLPSWLSCRRYSSSEDSRGEWCGFFDLMPLSNCRRVSPTPGAASLGTLGVFSAAKLRVPVFQKEAVPLRSLLNTNRTAGVSCLGPLACARQKTEDADMHDHWQSLSYTSHQYRDIGIDTNRAQDPRF